MLIARFAQTDGLVYSPRHCFLIFQAYCHYQEAALHLRHVLELNPNYAPAIAALQDMESIPDSSIHAYTLVIIVFLVLAVLLWILSTLDISLEELVGLSSDAAASSASTNGHANGHGGKMHRMRFHMRNGSKRTG